MNYNEYLELVTRRRTIRKFTEKPVSKDDIKKIIKTGALAPSGFNSQPWEFVVVSDEVLRNELMRYLQAAMKNVDATNFQPNMSMTFATAPTFIIVYGAFRNDGTWLF